LRSRAAELESFRNSIFQLLTDDILGAKRDESSVKALDDGSAESMDVEVLSALAMLHQEDDDSMALPTATSSDATTDTPKGRKRKKYCDGMGDDTLRGHYNRLDDLLSEEYGMTSFLVAVFLSIDKDPELVQAWHEARLNDELRTLIGMAKNIIKALYLLPDTSHVRTVLVKFLSLGLQFSLICLFLLEGLSNVCCAYALNMHRNSVSHAKDSDVEFTSLMLPTVHRDKISMKLVLLLQFLGTFKVVSGTMVVLFLCSLVGGTNPTFKGSASRCFSEYLKFCENKMPPHTTEEIIHSSRVFHRERRARHYGLKKGY
jgi:hypothetical protein